MNERQYRLNTRSVRGRRRKSLVLMGIEHLGFGGKLKIAFEMLLYVLRFEKCPNKGAVLSPAYSQAWALPLPHTAITRDRLSEMLTFNNIANARKRILAIKNQRLPC